MTGLLCALLRQRSSPKGLLPCQLLRYSCFPASLEAAVAKQLAGKQGSRAQDSLVLKALLVLTHKKDYPETTFGGTFKTATHVPCFPASCFATAASSEAGKQL